MLKKSINFEQSFKSWINSDLRSLISAGSKKCIEFREFVKTYFKRSVPLKFDAQFVKTTADEEFKICKISTAAVDSTYSGPKLRLSPTSLNITFVTEKDKSENSKIVVKPCFPFLIFKLISFTEEKKVIVIYFFSDFFGKPIPKQTQQLLSNLKLSELKVFNYKSITKSSI